MKDFTRLLWKVLIGFTCVCVLAFMLYVISERESHKARQRRDAYSELLKEQDELARKYGVD